MTDKKTPPPVPRKPGGGRVKGLGVPRPSSPPKLRPPTVPRARTSGPGRERATGELVKAPPSRPSIPPAGAGRIVPRAPTTGSNPIVRSTSSAPVVRPAAARPVPSAIPSAAPVAPAPVVPAPVDPDAIDPEATAIGTDLAPPEVSRAPVVPAPLLGAERHEPASTGPPAAGPVPDLSPPVQITESRTSGTGHAPISEQQTADWSMISDDFDDALPARPSAPTPTTLEGRQRRHVLFTWTRQSAARPVSITGGKGAWFTDQDGQRWLDFESQVFNANLGHGETRVSRAIAQQAQSLACAHPAAVFEAKAKLGEAIARITPGDLDTSFFCLSGAEANENALKIARLITGRQKVIARRRSYHGATMGALSLTGDNRRWPVEPGLWGVLRADDPYCYRCPYGMERPQCGTRCAQHIEHIIEMEGPESIAAVFLEGVTGTAGAFIPPPDYWPMVREICTRHGILLVADEVLSGFGRTGRWFAVDHWGVVPDMIVMAKGITGGYAPLAAVAMRRWIAERFTDETLWCGLTGYAHPLSCAAGVAAIEAYEEDGLIDHAARLGVHLRGRLQALKDKHPIIGDVRNLGLLGTIEFVRNHYTREPLIPYAAPTPPDSVLARLDTELRARNMHICRKWTHLFVAPPLCATQEDLDEGIDRIDAAITAATGAPA